MLKKGGKSLQNRKDKRRDKLTQFMEWNFLKREKQAKKERLRKDHPSFNIVMKLLDKYKQGKEIT